WLQPGVTCVFESANGFRCESDFPLGKAALSVLSPLCPTALSFEETLARSLQSLRDNGVNCADDFEAQTQLAEFLMKLYTVGLVDFRATQPPVATRVSEKPVASPLARWQIQRGNSVTSLFHIVVQIEDEVGENMINWLDGSADRNTLIEKLWTFLQ